MGYSDLILGSMDSSTLAKPNREIGQPLVQGISIVTGSRGQDGSYLRDLLGYDKSIGCINPVSESGSSSLRNEVSVDLADKASVLELLRETRPKSIFHLAARHGPSTKMTFGKEDTEAMRRTHVDATRNFLEAIETLRLDTHLVVAGSSRIFTATEEVTRISEDSQPNPRDYYGESKLAAWELVKNHRTELGTRASFLVLFNHESPRRPKGYLSQDIAHAIHLYLERKSVEIVVRDTEFMGDWCDARDVVALMSKLAKRPNGEDLVVGSGSLKSVSAITKSVLNATGASSATVKSSSAAEGKNARSFLVAQNNKSIELGIWTPKIPIEKTIEEIVVELVKSNFGGT